MSAKKNSKIYEEVVYENILCKVAFADDVSVILVGINNNGVFKKNLSKEEFECVKNSQTK